MSKTLVGVAILSLIAAGCSASSDPSPRTPAQSAEPPASARAAPPAPPKSPAAVPRRPRNAVLVYQLRKGREPWQPNAFGGSPRPARGARGAEGRLQAALRELVKGPTRAERQAGYSSAFGLDTADLVLRVELRGRRAVVDFRDFRRARGEWGTSYGGSVFLSQLNHTVFQFERVATAQYRIKGSCRKFWVFLQVVVCDPVRAGPFRRADQRDG